MDLRNDYWKIVSGSVDKWPPVVVLVDLDTPVDTLWQQQLQCNVLIEKVRQQLASFHHYVRNWDLIICCTQHESMNSRVQ